MHHIDAYYRSMGVNIYITTCRDIQTAVVKTCAYTDLDALKCAFGEEYNELYPYHSTIYSPPSLHIKNSLTYKLKILFTLHI